MKYILFFVFSHISLLISFQVFAHSEDKQVRYVAQLGKDIGECTLPVRPCQSLDYALNRATKGDVIKVSAGQYQITSPETLGYFLGHLINITGGFSTIDLFQKQAPERNKTVISGVPYTLRQQFLKRGFHVIADSKTAGSGNQAQSVKRVQGLTEFHSNELCSKGFAAGFPCENMDLVSHVPLPGAKVGGSDIWGHTDANTGIEYAIMGFSDGVRIYSLADPSEPALVSHIQGTNTIWRDIKVYQFYDEASNLFKAYAYVSSESASNQLQIIDLTLLPEKATLLPAVSIYGSAHNLFISGVDYAYNLPLTDSAVELHVSGADKYDGAVTRYALAQYASPELINVPDEAAGYTHDNTIFTLTDERAAASCGGKTLCQVLVDFNEDKVKLWDISTDSNALLSEFEYTDVTAFVRYVHSGWATEDGQFLFVHDELDERRTDIPTTIRVISLEDPSALSVVKRWEGETKAIDHNGFVRGNRYYFSHYERGVTILDISQPADPQRIANFDTFPTSNNANFNGAWGVYPFFPSGHIIVSDLNAGLFVLKPKTTASHTVSFVEQAVTLNENQTQQIAVSISGTELLLNDQTVVVEAIPASARAGTDYQAVNSTLTFNKDATTQYVDIRTLSSGNDSQQTHFYLRLSQPSEALQLGTHHYAKVNIGQGVSQGSPYAYLAESEVSENVGILSASVTRKGGSDGELEVYYKLLNSDSTDVSLVSGSLQWGDKNSDTLSVDINVLDDDAIEDNETFTLVFSLDPMFETTLQSLTFTIVDDDNNQPPTVNAGQDLQIEINSVFTLASATVSDDKDDAVDVFWEQISGPPIELSNTSMINQLMLTIGDQSGTAVLQVTATDSHGETAIDTVTIVITSSTLDDISLPVDSNESSGGGSLYYLGLFLLMILRRHNSDSV